MDDDDENQQTERKRKKRLPKISNADGGLTPVIKVTVGGRMVNALFKVDRETSLWLEYSPVTLFSLAFKESKVPSPKKSPLVFNRHHNGIQDLWPLCSISLRWGHATWCHEQQQNTAAAP